MLGLKSFSKKSLPITGKLPQTKLNQTLTLILIPYKDLHSPFVKVEYRTLFQCFGIS